MKNPFKSRFQRWVDRRIPAKNEILLGHRQLFIFASRAGWMFAAILVLMLVGATNYQNSLGFALSFLLLAIGLLTILKSFSNLAGLRLTGLAAAPVFAGENALFAIMGKSVKGSYSVGFGYEGITQTWVDFPPGETIQFSIKFNTQHRGWQKTSRIYLHSEYPLGILRCWSWLDLQQQVLVYPKPIKPTEVDDLLDGENDPLKGNIQPGDDYEENRRYQTGDSPRHIDWKIYAKVNELYTKKFNQPKGNEIWLNWDQFPGVEKELRLSYLCYQVLGSEKSNQAYGLKLPHVTLGPAQGAAHQQHCLTALATFGKAVDEQPHIKSPKGWFYWLRVLYAKQPGVINDKK